MRVLVTGATGFVASHLVPALAEDGHTVIALGHDPGRIPAADGVEPVVVDLRAPVTPLPSAEAIVHLAQANVRFPEGAAELFAVNTAATAMLLEHARAVGARSFVLASSASVYGLGDRSFREEDPTAARDFYAATKVAAERLVDAYGDILATSTLRPVAPYGPGQRNRLIPTLAGRVREGKPITLREGGRPRMNPIYVGDLVRVVRRALHEGLGLINVGGDQTVTIRDLGELIGEALGLEPVFEEGAGAPSGDLVVNNARLRELLGEPLLPLHEGLAHMVHAEARA